ncbi:response regulator transcription factor [Endozoicomonas sp.]|uniref:helix-turn-helix transcriptional regulator n=1 Tax=Endozoicomonas sp. TaxID=1892382 RepID=UPI003AF4DDAE
MDSAIHSSHRHRAPTEWSDLSEHSPLDAETLAVLTRRILLSMQQLGFSDFHYYGLFDAVPGTECQATDHFNLELFRRTPQCLSSEGIDVVQRFFRETDGDARMWHSICYERQPFQRSLADSGSPQERRVLDFMMARQIRSQLFVPVYGYTGNGWHCQFLLNSPLSPQALALWLQDHKQALLMTCFYFHTLLMRDFHYLFNPWLHHQVISDRALDVLKLTANGLGSKEIAGKINLSEKGVNYHLNHLRELLGAENRVHLVAMAKELRII